MWGTGWFKSLVNPIFTWNYPVDGLHNLVQKVPPVVAKPASEGAVFAFTYLSFTGSGMLLAAIISGFVMRFSPVKLVVEYGRTIKVCAYSLITISAMLAIGTLTRYSGIDATLGLAFAGAGVLYPFFGTLLGWLGVALTGSDTASNVLFGGLQKITSEQLGLPPILMAAANSSGGVMGKMIDAQSIVVASTATNWFGHEGSILRFVFFHSIALACLVGLLVMLQAYVLHRHDRALTNTLTPRPSTTPRRRRGVLVYDRAAVRLRISRVTRQLGGDDDGWFAVALRRATRSCLVVCAHLVPAVANERRFPFGREMMLDTAPMPGSKRVPILEIDENGAASIDLWCASLHGQASVSDDTISIVPGPMQPAQCAPDRQTGDENLLAAIAQVTNWRRSGDVIELRGATTLRFRLMTN